MKELSIEEKAKAYDEAIERAKVFKEHLLEINEKDYADEMNYIFPELAESEDEKIRKALIFHYQGDGCICTNEYRIDFKDIRTWLEKQVEQKSTNNQFTPEQASILDKHIDKFLEHNPTEWSEEDEDNLNSAIYYIRREPYRECDVEPVVDWLRNKFKSLRPQSQWKPSEEQIMALDSAIHCYAGISPTNNREVYALEIMKEQLKKLREK